MLFRDPAEAARARLVSLRRSWRDAAGAIAALIAELRGLDRRARELGVGPSGVEAAPAGAPPAGGDDDDVAAMSFEALGEACLAAQREVDELSERRAQLEQRRDQVAGRVEAAAERKRAEREAAKAAEKARREAAEAFNSRPPDLVIHPDGRMVGSKTLRELTEWDGEYITMKGKIKVGNATVGGGMRIGKGAVINGINVVEWILARLDVQPEPP